jgi:hypothetical protein
VVPLQDVFETSPWTMDIPHRKPHEKSRQQLLNVYIGTLSVQVDPTEELIDILKKGRLCFHCLLEMPERLWTGNKDISIQARGRDFMEVLGNTTELRQGRIRGHVEFKIREQLLLVVSNILALACCKYPGRWFIWGC